MGEAALEARPLVPVAFPGDVALRAEGVAGPCDDFNVMVRRGVVRAEVDVLTSGVTQGASALFALDEVQVAGRVLAPFDLLLADESVEFLGRAIQVQLHGLPDKALKQS